MKKMPNPKDVELSPLKHMWDFFINSSPKNKEFSAYQIVYIFLNSQLYAHEKLFIEMSMQSISSCEKNWVF